MRMELIDPRTRSTRMRITDGCELDRLLFDDLINADQHWAGGKLAEAVVRVGGTKSCLANIERTSGGRGSDRSRGCCSTWHWTSSKSGRRKPPW